MKIMIKKAHLEGMLLNLQAYLEKKDLSQITSHVHFNVQEGQLTLKSTDYEIGLCFTSKEFKSLSEGHATANGKKLLDIIKSLKESKEDDTNSFVTLETINDYLYIKQNSSKFKLPMLNPHDFPSFPTIESKPAFKINSLDFVKAIKKISPAIDTNNPKYELNGALIHIKEEAIECVATDTKRLAIHKIDQKNEHPFSLIIPRKAIAEMQKLFLGEAIEMVYDEHTLIATTSEFLFYTKLINGKFPDYERIIPKSIQTVLMLPRDAMIEAIKQIAIISTEIKMSFKTDKIVFESLNDDNIEAKTEIELKNNLSHEFYLAANSRYVLDFLSHIETPTCQLSFNDSALPFMLESETFKTIIMPINI